MEQRIYTGVAAKEIDRLAIVEHGVAGFDLMSEAGNKAFELLQVRFSRPARLLVLCGSGNNGGDGYILASCAIKAGWRVRLVATDKPKTIDAKMACQQFVDDGGQLEESGSLLLEEKFDVVVDALLGIGLSGAPAGIYAELIDLTNSLDAMVYSLDVPSGIDADTGAVYAPAIRAEMTATFIVPKIGLMTGPATSYVGELQVVELSVPDAAIQSVEPIATCVEPNRFAPRSKDSHKGNYGSLVVAGGDHGMFGAVLLSGEAALRTGSGKVTVLSTDEHLDRPALRTPELMSAVFEGVNSASLQQADVVALGPGLGLGRWGKEVFEIVIGLRKPLLIDADALSHLAASKNRGGKSEWVVTPHPGEAAKLLGVETSKVQSDRPAAVVQIARQTHSVCVLKGAGTLIATPAGEVSLCTAGNPGMASAGMGDVLSGIIASLLGQGIPAEQAAKTGVWLHAVAADWWVSENCESSLMAGDVVRNIAGVIRSIS